MKNYLFTLLAIVFLFSNCKSQETLTDSKSKASYALGASVAKNLQSQSLGDINVDLFIDGLKDAMGNSDLRIPEDSLMTAIQSYQMSKTNEAADKNLAEAEAFLAEKRKDPNVKSTDSGLLYEVIKSGDGISPTATDKVTTHYHGMLIDGTVFDSSVDRGEPATFGVNQVIPGWTEALQMMKVGDKWRLYLAPDLAYGARGAGAQIGPNSALIFDVELLDVEKQ